MIKYKHRPNEEYKLATIISRAGKASGKYSNWYNIQNASSNIKEAKDLGAIEWQTYENQDSDVEQFVNQQTQEALVLTSIEKNDTRYDIAKQKEIDEWTHFKVYEEVNRNEYPEDEILSCRWVTEEKQSNGGIQYKARLVIRGFEEKNSPQSDSPTANKCVIRLFLAISNIRNFKLNALDVKRAFLQSN